MQMRKIWGVMLDPEFDPRAMADSRRMPFKKSMEGAGIESDVDGETPDMDKGSKAAPAAQRARRRKT